MKRLIVYVRREGNYFIQSTNFSGLKLKGKNRSKKGIKAQVYNPFSSTQR